MNITTIVLQAMFYLSLLRATNIPLVYGPESTNADPTQTILNVLIAALLVSYIFLKNNYYFIKVITNSPILIVFTALILLSGILSVSPLSSAKYIITLIVISIPIIIYTIEYGLDKTLKNLTIYIIIFSIINFLYIFIRPEYGIMSYPHEGLWSGMLSHKNMLGAFSATSFIILIHQARRASFVYLMFLIITIIITAICLLKSGSTTGLICFLITCTLYPGLLLLFRLNAAERLAILIGIVSILPVFIFLISPFVAQIIFELTGKDANLTGRTDIWLGLWNIVLEKPMFGHGAGMAERADYISLFQDLMGKKANSTHNSYLSLMINFGIPTSLFIILMLFKVLFSGLMLQPKVLNDVRNLSLAVCLIFSALIAGYSETAMIFSRSIVWVYMLLGIIIIKTPSSYLKPNK